nr:FAD-dependent oxidoreductase [Methylocella silvestris]
MKRAAAQASSAPANPPRGVGIVVVGAGLAGWAVVEAIRAADAGTPITMVCGGKADLYNKPELSLALSRGLTASSLVRESGAAAARRLGVRLCEDTFAIGLAPALRQLRTTRGALLYTHLVLAQGARPALPAELPSALCWRINDLATWGSLQERLAQRPQRVAIVGAGMIGCELAEDFARAGHRVTLFDRQTLPLSGLLPEPAAKRLKQSHAKLGVDYLGGVEIARVEALGDGAKLLETRCGRSVTVDHIVAATGLATDHRLARSGALAFDCGIKVDPLTLAASAPGVYALGDCVSIEGATCRFVEPIARQADAVAHHVTGRWHEGYRHSRPAVRLKSKILPIELSGAPCADGEWRIIREDDSFLHMEQWRDGTAAASLRVGTAKAASFFKHGAHA